MSDPNKKLLWWYERVADWLIANPQGSYKEAAAVFGCHVNTIYAIKNSDSFRLYFEARSTAISQEIDAGMVAGLGSMPEKLNAIAEQAIDLMAEKMSTKGNEMGVQSVVAIADLALKKLGYGTSAVPAGANVQVNNFNMVSGPMLEKARQKLLEARGPDRPVPALTPPRVSIPMSEDAA